MLDLSHFLHEEGISHRIVCYYDLDDFPSLASWPLRVVQLKPGENALARAVSLRRFLVRAQKEGAGRPLLVGLLPARHVCWLPSPTSMGN